MRKSTVFESRRSMKPRTPSKTRKSMAAPSNRQSLGVRYSMAGKQSIGGAGSTVKGTNKKRHTTKDSRGFSQKTRQREFCAELTDFLLETRCKKEFTTKIIMEMTTGNYAIIFTHLATMILGELKDAHKGSMAELIVNTMNSLNYPFTLTKSSFVNFSLTSWPIALGVLHYLHAMATMEQCEENIDDFDDDAKEVLYEAKYSELNENEDHELLMERAAKDYEDYVLQDDEEIERHIQAELEHNHNENRVHQKTMNDKMELERDFQEKNDKYSKLKSFVTHREQAIAKLDEAIDALNTNTKVTQDEASQLKRDSDELNAQIGDKDTAIDLKVKLEKIQDELGRLEVDRVHFEGLEGDLVVAFTKVKDRLDDHIQTYNQQVYECKLNGNAIKAGKYNEGVVLPDNVANLVATKCEATANKIADDKLRQLELTQKLDTLMVEQSQIEDIDRNDEQKFERKKRSLLRKIEHIRHEVDNMKQEETQLQKECDDLDEKRKETERQRDVDARFVKEHSLERFVDALADKDEANKETILANLQAMVEAIDAAEISVTEYVDQLISAEKLKFKRVLALSDSLDELLN